MNTRVRLCGSKVLESLLNYLSKLIFYRIIMMSNFRLYFLARLDTIAELGVLVSFMSSSSFINPIIPTESLSVENQLRSSYTFSRW